MAQHSNDLWRAEFFRSFIIEDGCAFSQRRAGDFLAEAQFYLKTIEEFIEGERARELELLGKEADLLPESCRGNFWADYYPIHWETIFESQLRSSFVVSLASFIEDYIKTVGWEVAIIMREGKDPREISRDVLRNLRRFLENRGGFREPDDSLWGFLYNTYRLRNVLVHNGGKLHGPRRYKDLTHFIASESGLSEEHGFIKIGRLFCEKALQHIQQFVQALNQQQRSLCKRAAEQGAGEGRAKR